METTSHMSTSEESEATTDCRLLLTTLSGKEVEVSTNMAQFDRFEDFEELIVDHLATSSELDVFGSELDFQHPTTQAYLEGRIWEALQENRRFTLLFWECVEIFQTKEDCEACAYRDIPKAVKVPANELGVIPPSAFIAVPRMRHVIVAEGILTVGARAWQNCRRLRIVKMPTTVVRIEESAFRGCHWLNSITAPGCTDFGYKAFADCFSLQWVHANGGVNNISSATKIGHYLFDSCINLATMTILHAGDDSDSPTPVQRRELPTGCFCSTGLKEFQLPRDFYKLGAHACDNCKLLSYVDISDTNIEEIREFTFVHCIRLYEVRLPYTVHTIHPRAFMNCAALQELAIPPSLHYIACRAFLDCTVLWRLTRMPGQRTTWRGTYAEETAFELCPAWRWPLWLHMIRDPG